MYKSQFKKIDPYDCVCGPGSHILGHARLRVDIVYGRNYDGIWSSSNLRLSFLIN